MGTFLNNDDSIWFKHIEGHPDTIGLLHQLKAGSQIKIEIEGVCGVWEKMKNQPDGSSTPGLKPIGQTREFWKTMKPLRGKRFEFKIINPRDTYLADVQKTLSEWESEEDEEAFNDL